MHSICIGCDAADRSVFGDAASRITRHARSLVIGGAGVARPRVYGTIARAFSGELSERPKEHDWKSCRRQKRLRGSNPRLSASRSRGAGLGLRSSAAFTPCGGVAEWTIAAVSKTVYPVSPGTRVRIPPPPPVRADAPKGAFLVLGGGGGIRTRRARNAPPERPTAWLSVPLKPRLSLLLVQSRPACAGYT